MKKTLHQHCILAHESSLSRYHILIWKTFDPLWSKLSYYIDTSVLLENIPLVKFIKTTSGTRVVSLSMISLKSSLSPKLYLNSLVYYRNIFGSSSKVFGNLRKSSGIFGNSRKFSENVRERSSGLRNNFRKSSEGGRKSSENHQKRLHQHVYIITGAYHSM